MVKIILENTNIRWIVSVCRILTSISARNAGYAPTPETRFSMSSVLVGGHTQGPVVDMVVRCEKILITERSHAHLPCCQYCCHCFSCSGRSNLSPSHHSADDLVALRWLLTLKARFNGTIYVVVRQLGVAYYLPKLTLLNLRFQGNRTYQSHLG